MKLGKFLTTSGWSRADLARHLGLTRGALTKWDDVPDVHIPKLLDIMGTGMSPPNPVKKAELSDLELLEVIRTRGSVSDFDICRAHGWRVPEFNQMIADLTKKYPLNGESWKTHEFWGQVGGES